MEGGGGGKGNPCLFESLFISYSWVIDHSYILHEFANLWSKQSIDLIIVVFALFYFILLFVCLFIFWYTMHYELGPFSMDQSPSISRTIVNQLK